MSTNRKEKLKMFLEEKQKDKKNNLKIGSLDSFNVGGLESTIPTLHLPIDDLVGGLQKGTIWEIYGEESSGKTTTLGKLFENMKITMGEDMPSVIYIDAEGTFNMKFFRRFRHLTEDDVVFLKECIIENIWNTIEELIEADAIDMIVIDSISALQTLQEDDKGIDGNNVASLPRKVNTMIKKFYKLAEDSGLTIMVVNSTYKDIPAFGSFGGPKDILRGGSALRYGKSVSIEVKKSFSKSAATIEKINGEDVMTEAFTTYTAKKNKLGTPMRSAATFLNVAPGATSAFNYTKDVLAYATKFGFIEKRGAWFFAKDSAGEEIYKCAGGAKMAQYIEANPALYIKLKFLCYSKIYEPFEFYFHFDTLKNMLYREFKAIGEQTLEEIQYMEDLDEDVKEALEELANEETDILGLSVSDILTPKEILKAENELKRFYSEEKVQEIKEKNFLPEKTEEIKLEESEEN